MAIGERATGVTKWFNEELGYGFIMVQGQEKDIFVHRQQLFRSGVEKLAEGDKVNFIINDGRKGKFATNIQKVP